ncbi:MAG: hypothetical protein ACOVLE_10010, partial [Pirellula staleyi]
MIRRPCESCVRWAFFLVIILVAQSLHQPSDCSAQSARPLAPPGGKFHQPPVPARMGEDPWGPAK